MDIHQVKISKHAERDIRKLPAHIIYKLQLWIDGVKQQGLTEMRKRPGFNDEALRGKRQGQRSI